MEPLKFTTTEFTPKGVILLKCCQNQKTIIKYFLIDQYGLIIQNKKAIFFFFL